MIQTCPACNTRYRVDDAALADPAGRDLRCAKCGHQWRYVPKPGDIRPEPAPPTGPAAPIVSAPPVPPAAPVAQTPAPAAAPAMPAATAPSVAPGPLVASPAAPPGPMSPTAPAASPPASAPVARPRGSRVGLGCLAVIVILAFAIAGVVLARDRVVALWPAAGKFYRTVGLRLEPVGAGLEIGKVAPSRNGDVLVVEGDVTNTTDADRKVPRLRVILRDAGGKELAGKVIEPPASELAGGAAAHFKTQFEHPSDAATGVAVTFTSGR